MKFLIYIITIGVFEKKLDNPEKMCYDSGNNETVETK